MAAPSAVPAGNNLGARTFAQRAEVPAKPGQHAHALAARASHPAIVRRQRSLQQLD